MSAKTKPLVSLTLAQKKDIITGLKEQHLSPEFLAERYNVSISTIYRIQADEKEIMEATGVSLSLKRKRSQQYDEIDLYLIEWVEQALFKNLIITDDILRAQALFFAKQQNITDFKASHNWVLAFKKRHGIRSVSIQGESTSVNRVTVKKYIEDFQTTVKEFEAKNVFNLDETALFYKLLPNKTLCNQAKASGVKSSKERVSVAFCVSLAGEKMTPLVIGKARNPRSFKGVDLKRIGIEYTSTCKSWMTSGVFQEYLRSLNQQMVKQKRKILLLIDNAPSHLIYEELTNIKIEFLPKDTTSVLQPLDQGIIRSFKSHYKNALITYLAAVGNNTPETMKSINLGIVVNWISDAWKKVSATTIINCFQKTGLFGGRGELLSSDTAEYELQARLTEVRASVNVEEYLSADDIDLTYDCSDDQLSQVVFERMSAFQQEHDEEGLIDKTKSPLEGFTRAQILAQVEELRKMMNAATTPSLRRNLQEAITELLGGVEQMCKQVKLMLEPLESP